MLPSLSTGSAGIGGRLGPIVIFHGDDEDRLDGVGMNGAGQPQGHSGDGDGGHDSS
jgi:hypothetical protein